MQYENPNSFMIPRIGMHFVHAVNRHVPITLSGQSSRNRQIQTVPIQKELFVQSLVDEIPQYVPFRCMSQISAKKRKADSGHPDIAHAVKMNRNQSFVLQTPCGNMLVWRDTNSYGQASMRVISAPSDLAYHQSQQPSNKCLPPWLIPPRRLTPVTEPQIELNSFQPSSARQIC